MPISGGFCLFEVCFIKPTAATIRHESDPMLAAVFLMNRDVPNMWYMRDRHLAACPCLPVPPVRCQMLKSWSFLRPLPTNHCIWPYFCCCCSFPYKLMPLFTHQPKQEAITAQSMQWEPAFKISLEIDSSKPSSLPQQTHQCLKQRSATQSNSHPRNICLARELHNCLK